MEFTNKIVIITGAAGGIGEAAAKLFAKEGAKLTLVDINEGELKRVTSELGVDESNYLIQVTDVAKEEQVKNYVDQTLQKYGRVDVFVNNAGVEGKVKGIVETTAEELEFVLGVNVKGVYYGLKHVLPTMIANKYGSIINTSSVAGFIGSPGLAPYIASKHAVLGITKTAALEVAPYGIRVNAVCPGPVDNRMMRSIEEGAAPGQGAVVQQEFEKMIPLGRYATNEEVADLIYFLASDKAKYLTGVAYRVDGGMGAK
jgi:NAD(P)-dependent dehydrogenase (short-subunit alcohol dehydrogenase family)